MVMFIVYIDGINPSHVENKVSMAPVIHAHRQLYRRVVVVNENLGGRGQCHLGARLFGIWDIEDTTCFIIRRSRVCDPALLLSLPLLFSLIALLCSSLWSSLGHPRR